MSMIAIRLAFATLVVLLAVPAQAQTAPFELAVVAEGLDNPIFVTAPAGDSRLFIVEQTGKVRIMRDGTIDGTPFADFGSLTRFGGERGLLGLAFHPDYAANGRFFVNYTDKQGDTHVVGYTVSADADVADMANATELLFVDQPQSNHNGGWISFGPDGLLYVAMGDGGGAGDVRNNAQNPKTLLGKMVRLNVDGGTPEIFLSGVRNPWRNAWDGDTLYLADVGQSQWEEVNVVTPADAGGNLGWRLFEGEVCFSEITCDPAGKIMPVHVYSHDEGCSITGGYVYRGSAIPAIAGRYFFGDYCTGTIWSLVYGDGAASDVVSHANEVGPITSFGLDSAGEMYLLTQDGILRKFVPAS
jgi:glucose/arabinose dehydrogenase